MTPKPTAEQIEAAKRWTRSELNKEDALLLAWSEMPPESILLAALEAAEQDREPKLLAEQALDLCREIEASPASEQLTKCSLLAVQLRAELEKYEETRPMDDREKGMIEAAWNRFDAARKARP